MFKEAIKKNRECVKALGTAYKTPYSDDLVTNTLSVMLLNDEGWALTTKSVANNIVVADKISEAYETIKQELLENKVPPKKIYKKYKINEDSAIIMRNVFLNTLDSWDGIKIIAHEYLDLALLKFENPHNILCHSFPVFAKKNSEQGEYLCRLGYPYPEFKAFKYDYSRKDIVLNPVLEANLQLFPLDGMLTRYLSDSKNKVTLFELSNLSFMGHTGGPVINTSGEVVGMQVGTAYKDTELDVDVKLKRGPKEVEVKQFNFMPFSICVNVQTIIEFLDKNNVKYKTK